MSRFEDELRRHYAHRLTLEVDRVWENLIVLCKGLPWLEAEMRARAELAGWGKPFDQAFRRVKGRQAARRKARR